MTKLKHLSDARARRVLSLIQDLAQLEALENTADLKAARDALAEAEEPLPWEQVEGQIGCAIRSASADELKNSSVPGFLTSRFTLRHLFGTFRSLPWQYPETRGPRPSPAM